MNRKGFSAVALIIIVGVLVFAGALGVRYLTQKSEDETAKNLFDLATVEVGDTVAGMKVVSIGPVLRKLPLSSQNLVNMSIGFRGEAQISGEYHMLNDPITCNYLKLDEASRNNLPGLKDAPLNSLCIFVQDPKLDFKRGGRATVVIDDLLLNYVAAGIPSGAKIVKVIADQPK